jgi:hypothetical protein
MFFHL